MDKLKRTSAKRARRDTRRRKAQRRRPAGHESREMSPAERVRRAFGNGEPAEVLSLVSVMVEASSPQSFLPRRRGANITHSLDDFVAGFIGLKTPETTALLAVLGELSTNDDALQARCRSELAKRDDALPAWLDELAKTAVYQVMRRADVLGDGDALLLGIRLTGGRELTFAVYVDHLALSSIAEAFLLAKPLDEVLSLAQAGGDPDTTYVEFGLADARAHLLKALDSPLSDFPTGDSEHWPGSRAMLRWLVHLLPDGGLLVSPPDSTAVLERFFASWAGVPFSGWDYETLLGEFVYEGTGNPLRWSAERMQLALNRPTYDEYLSLDVQLDAPELLRAYVPFAHAESGIRHELTAQAVATIDELAENYREAVMESARESGYFDD
jgi:hypothetical protein